MSSTARKMVEQQREAFKVGARVRWNKGYRYEVPRLVPINGGLYRFIKGQFEFKNGGDWQHSTSYSVATVTALADLMKTPMVDA